MGYSIALTAGAQAQNEGNGGGAGSWTYTLTRTGADINGAPQTYSFHVFNPDTTPSDDFTGTTGGNNTFVWAGGAGTTTVTFNAVQDFTVESNETPIIWFYSDNTSLGTPILRNNDLPANVITITNDDTGAPVFSTAAAITAPENGTAVATIAASAGGTAVAYTLTGGADVAQFTIDATTGALTWAANNFEAPDDTGANGVYNVQVTATAGGATTVLDLAVTLTNVNEDPVITSNGGGAAAAGVPAVAENTTAVLASNTRTDVDAGDTVTWSISGGADSAKFVINSQTGALAFASAPNFEAHADVGANDVFDVTIRATDAGGLFDEQTVAVTLTNVDDPAVITSYSGADLLLLHASENTLTTTALATGTATDDEGNAITWSTAGPDAAQFSATGGVLTFNVSPDFEAPGDANGDNVYDVTLTATSSGGADTQRFLIFLDNVIEAGETGGGGGGFVLPPTPPAPPPPGGSGNDDIVGTPGADSRAGGGGDDTINGDAGDDQIDGDAGNDRLLGGEGSDFIRGLADNDFVSGGAGSDTVNGNLGDDTVNGDDGADTVYGGQGNDSVLGGAGDDPYVNGNIGNDTVHGETGNDSVYGGQNDDIIYGDDGNDLLSGDLGNDLMYGGDGADRFTMAPGGGSDWVLDFNGAAGDRIQFAPGTTYTVSSYLGQVMITLTGGGTLGLAGVASIQPDWIIFG